LAPVAERGSAREAPAFLICPRQCLDNDAAHRGAGRPLIEWIGWDRLLFASDYPHWDFDDPVTAFPIDIPADRRRQFLVENAKALYGVK
jgi:predicted TIM-barrel fold metal-dependent hydrolase